MKVTMKHGLMNSEGCTVIPNGRVIQAVSSVPLTLIPKRNTENASTAAAIAAKYHFFIISM